MLKFGEINPLNVFCLRQVHHCPPHFQKIIYDARTADKKITDWIYENLAGRFYLGDTYIHESGESPKIQKCVAFETHSEATYFSLMLDKLNSYTSIF